MCQRIVIIGEMIYRSRPAMHKFGLAALFFAGVGWESVTAVVPATATGAWRTAAGVSGGVAAVALVHLGLAAVTQLAPIPSPAPEPLRWVLAVATAAVLTSYCSTNVRTAARIAGRLRSRGSTAREPGRAAVTAVGVACCAFACLGVRDGAVPLLLLGPAAAAIVGYALAAVAAMRSGGLPLRCTGAAVLLVLLTIALLAVPLLLA